MENLLVLDDLDFTELFHGLFLQFNPVLISFITIAQCSQTREETLIQIMLFVIPAHQLYLHKSVHITFHIV